MTLQIEAFRDYVMIGTQRVNRPADIPAHVWMTEWDWMNRERGAKTLCRTCDRYILKW